MDAILCKQPKPLTVSIISYFLLFILLCLLFTNTAPLSQYIFLSIICFVLIGYAINYKVSKDFVIHKHFTIFGFTVFKSTISFPFPDYIIVFSSIYKQGAEWGSVAAMGNKRTGDNYVIRLFKGNKHFTLFRTTSFEIAKQKAIDLSNLTNVEIRGKN